MALHTTDGCKVVKNTGFSGKLISHNCYIKDPSQRTNQGCQIKARNESSYGTGFNKANGGVFATEWTSNFIKIWHFPRAKIPADIKLNKPNPNNWGIPLARFPDSCSIDQHFKENRIVFDITFCGDWYYFYC